MIEYDGKNYVLKYNQKRIEMIEAVTNMPTMAELKRTGGYLGLSSLKAYFAYGLKEEGSDAFVAPKKGVEICTQLIENESYEKVCGLVLENLERDCCGAVSKRYRLRFFCSKSWIFEVGLRGADSARDCLYSQSMGRKTCY